MTRNMLDNLCREFESFRTEIKEEFKELRNTNTKLYNHLSSRYPKELAYKLAWLTGVLGTIIGGIVVGTFLILIK